MLPFNDVGEGWLIFDVPMADLGVHPVEEDEDTSGMHDLSFFTDDLESTVRELEARGVDLDDEITEHSYGYVIHVTLPGDVRVQLFQPKYEKQIAVEVERRPARRSAQAKRPARKAKAKVKVKAAPKAKRRTGARSRRSV